MKAEEAKRLKELGIENGRRKKLVADAPAGNKIVQKQRQMRRLR